MKKVTCICDIFIKGVLLINGCEYEYGYDTLWGIMIYTPLGNVGISKWQFDNYFI